MATDTTRSKIVNFPNSGEAPAAVSPFHRFLTLRNGSECMFTFGYNTEICEWSSHIVSDSVDALVKMLLEAAYVLDSGGLRREMK